MHEYSIVGALLDQVERIAREQGAHAAKRLQVRIGELSGVEIPLLETAFETFRAGTCCADAGLEVERVPARWACPRCRAPAVRGRALRCAHCDVPVRLESGDEIILERVELEVA